MSKWSWEAAVFIDVGPSAQLSLAAPVLFSAVTGTEFEVFLVPQTFQWSVPEEGDHDFIHVEVLLTNC
jgi:hypothetical protein